MSTDDWLEKLPGIRDIVDDTDGGGVVMPRGSKLVLKGAVEITPTADGVELNFVGGPGGDGTGDVVGPASSVANRVPYFVDASGKLIGDSGLSHTAIIRSTGSVAFAADQSMGGFKLTNLGTPTSAGEAATKDYVDDLGADYITKDGTRAFTGDINLGGNQASNAGDAAASTDLTTLQQVQALIAATVSSVADWKQSVRVATTTALPASTRSTNTRTANANGAFPTVDGVSSLQVNDRILDKDHATGADRGIWAITSLGSVGTPWVLTRASDADSSVEVTSGMACAVEEGTANAGKIFLLTTAAPVTLNTTALSFTSIGTLAADGTTLTLTGSTLSIATNGVGNGQLRQGAACSFIGRGANSLGNVGDIAVGTNGFVALRRSNVLTAGLILDENVDPAAAIAGTKVAPAFGAQTVITTGGYRAGTNPATTGAYNAAHGVTVLAGRDSANAANRSLLRWGTTTDTLVLGDSAFASVLFGDDVTVGNTSDTWMSVNGSTNRVVMGHGGSASLSFGASLVEFGAVPASTGNIRLAHNMSIRGRDNANVGNRDLLTFGVGTADLLRIGDVASPTQVIGTSVALGDTTFIGLEHAHVAGARDVIAIGRSAALTATEMPSNTGSGVAYIANAAVDPTTGVPVSGSIVWCSAGALKYRGTLATATAGAGSWELAPNSQWARVHAKDDTGTTNSTSPTVIASFDTSVFPDNVAGVVKAWVYVQDVSNALAAQEIQAGFVIQSGTLIGGGAGAMLAGSAGQGAATFTYSGNLLRVSMTSADAVAKTYKVFYEFTFAVKT